MQVDYKWKEKAEELELKLAASEDKNAELQSQVDAVRKAKAKIDARINGKTVGEIKDAGDWPLCEASTWLYQALQEKGDAKS